MLGQSEAVKVGHKQYIYIYSNFTVLCEIVNKWHITCFMESAESVMCTVTGHVMNQTRTASQCLDKVKL